MGKPNFGPEKTLVPSNDPGTSATGEAATGEELQKRALETGFVIGIFKDDYFGSRAVDRSGAVPSSGAGGPVIRAARAVRWSRGGELPKV